jgi:hypothetical protein
MLKRMIVLLAVLNPFKSLRSVGTNRSIFVTLGFRKCRNGVPGTRADIEQGQDRLIPYCGNSVLDRIYQGWYRCGIGSANMAQGNHRFLPGLGICLLQFPDPMIDWLAVGHERFFVPAAPG